MLHPKPRYLSTSAAGLLLAIIMVISVSCGASPNLPPIGPFESEATEAAIRVSEFPDRRYARALNGATVSGNVYIYFDNGADHDQVAFRIWTTLPPVQTAERIAPFDLLGGSENEALPLDTRSFRDGTHEMGVEVTTPSGGKILYTAVFETRNGTKSVTAGDLYVAPGGTDDNDGSITRPLASLQAAIDRSSPGDLIYLREGMYRPSRTIEIAKSGTQRAPIRIVAYPGETPILDGSGLIEDAPILRLRASYWVVKGFELRNGPDFGLFLEYGRGNHLEDLAAHHNGHSGFHLEHHASWNSFVRLEAYENFDPESGGQHADGFAVKRSTAIGNVFLECRAWNNSDDGFDLLESKPQRIDRSEAFLNGYRVDGTPYPNGNGNGFKLGIGEGRWEAGGGHVVTRSVAWGNETWGFNSNNGTVPITVANSTAYGNGTRNFLFNNAAHVLVNNLSVEGDVVTSGEVVQERNSWQLGIDDPMFIATDPRDPESFHLAPGSPAIDKGATVGLEYGGEAPDLGAFERFP